MSVKSQSRHRLTQVGRQRFDLGTFELVAPAPLAAEGQAEEGQQEEAQQQEHAQPALESEPVPATPSAFPAVTTVRPMEKAALPADAGTKSGVQSTAASPRSPSAAASSSGGSGAIVATFTQPGSVGPAVIGTASEIPLLLQQ